MFDRLADTQHRRVCGQGRLLYRSNRRGLVPHAFPSQKVDAAIVGDAEQPRLEWATLIKLVKLSISLE